LFHDEEVTTALAASRLFLLQLFLFGVPVTHQGFRHFQPLATRVAASLDDCPDNRSPRIHVRWESAFVQQSLVTGSTTMAEPNNLIPENEERIALLEEQIATLLRQRQVTNEFSITAAAKLFEKGFSGEPSTLSEFIDNVEAAESLVHVDQKPILVKYILAKITGRDWIRQSNNERIPQTYLIPKMSETIIAFHTQEIGDRYCPKQQLNDTVYVAEGIVSCTDNTFMVSVINLSESEETITEVPVLEKLLSNIRLAHVKEGKEELLSLCQEYNDIFRLPGDRLTEVKGLVHTIPTPHINPHKPLTLKNYRLTKAHQDEVQKQVEIMLKQDIIKPSQSPWNFPLLVVPKKIDASGKENGVSVLTLDN
ncbi:hypothetical protein ANN_23857, partial [Periplaneta americana]